jgi:hypothetical protein
VTQIALRLTKKLFLLLGLLGLIVISLVYLIPEGL